MKWEVRPGVMSQKRSQFGVKRAHFRVAELETVTIRSKTCPFSGFRVRNGHDSDLNVPAFDEVCKKGHVSVFSSQLNL